MEKELIARFDAKRDWIKEELGKLLEKDEWDCFNVNYEDIVRVTIEAVHNGYGTPDPKAIHLIDDGDYQGTLLFVIAEDTYQPHDYWYVKVWYGSCSGCDTLQSILYCSDDKQEQVNDLFTLALHVVQGLKKMDYDYYDYKEDVI